MATMQKLTPNLWFDSDAEEAVNYYTSIFKQSKIGRIARFGKAGFEQHKRPEGSVMTIEFELDGQEFLALNGGPHFKFNEAISFIVNCDTQEEVDYFWEKLGAGGDPNAQMCGWLKDKFGLSWQVVPVQINDMMVDPDRSKVEKAMEAMFTMKKLDLATLEKAFNS